MNSKKYCYPLLLAAFTLLLIILVLPSGSLFGSNTDWFSQHVGIADHFRKTFYEQGTLFPDFSALGAGSNFYNYAYYGYLRPDVLIACLLPMVSMKYIIITYSIAGVLASVLLCYYWLTRQKLDPFFCFISSLLLASSTCFFHAHMQIMFVNYLPFLFLALLSIDRMLSKGSVRGLIFSLFMVYLHSFYFSISCLAVCLFYLLSKSRDRRFLIRFAISTAVSISMAGILLLPTAFVILENKKDAGRTFFLQIFAVNLPLKSLLYSRYGCGTVLVTLYTLLLGIREKKTRRFSLVLFLCLTVNLVSYLLNGTLYVRDKILIPFLPLVLLLCAYILQELCRGRVRHSLPLFAACLVPVFIHFDDSLIWLDAAVLLSFLLLGRRKPAPRQCLLLCIIPTLLYIRTGRTDLFVPAVDKRQTIFSAEEISEVCTDRNARMDCLVEPLANVNYLAFPEVSKTSVYSSTTNSLYSHFFYDIMRNPIRINNRVALLPDANPFFESLMGVRYLQTHADKVPYGYQVRRRTSDENGTYVLAENPDVESLAYASFQFFSEKKFDELNFPYTLDTISSHTIIPEETASDYTSQIHPVALPVPKVTSPDIKSVEKTDNSYELQVGKETTVPVQLDSPSENQVLILSFAVESLDGQEISISVNRVKNKLSNKKAPYPNENHTFTFLLSSNEEIRVLNLTLSKGHYRISHPKLYAMDADQIGNPGTIPLKQRETSGKQVLNGSLQLQKDGYFVTSLPWQHGYTAYVDGKETEIKVVNKAFVGFPLKKGNHEIILTFHAPWKTAGIFFTLAGFLIFLLILKSRPPA